MTAMVNDGGGELVPFKGQMIRREDVPRSSRVRPVAVQSMDDALRYAKVIAASGLLPKNLAEAGDPLAAAFVVIQLGAEVGLTPMASVQNIALINNRPGLFGPAMLAVCEASGLMETFEEWLEGEGESLTAYCKVKRRGRPEKVISFSWLDAKKAGLTTKKGPWAEYPKRMMQARARTFALRDTMPDVLLGLAYSVEELQDINRDPPRRGDVIEYAPDADPMPAPAAPIPERTETVAAPAAYPGAKPPLSVAVPGGWDPVTFPRGKRGLREALEFMSGAILEGGAEIVSMNAALLDQVAAAMPDLAEEVANLRAAADEMLLEGSASGAAFGIDADETERVPGIDYDDGGDPDADVFPGDLPSREISGA